MKRLFIPLPALNANSHGTAKRGEKRHWQYEVPLERGELHAWRQTSFKIDRDVVYTERRCRQVFPECLFWVVFYSVQFYLSRQLTQEKHGIVESKEKRELCMYLLDFTTDYIKIMLYV